MATLGRISLNSGQQGDECGAVFTLTVSASATAKIEFDGAEVETSEKQRDVVVRFSGTSDPAQVFARGHELAQKGLDLLSILGKVDAVTTHADEEHTLWWMDGGILTVRLVSTILFEFSVPPVKLEVRDKVGNLIPQLPAALQHHIGFRYFRLAQATDDLYDAYRNMYLAFEVLLSSQYPIQKGEREGDWLKRALTQAGSTVRLIDLIPMPTADVEAAVLDLIYHDARLPLFHAKDGKDFYAPAGNAANRETVSKALEALTHIVIRMAEAWFKMRRVRGGVFFAWVYANAANTFKNATMLVSDDTSPFDKTESDLSHPRFATAPRLNSRLAPELQKGNAPALFGTAERADLKGLSVIRRIEVILGTTPYMAQHLESDLTLDGIGRFEVVLHTKVTNRTEPKARFKL